VKRSSETLTGLASDKPHPTLPSRIVRAPIVAYRRLISPALPRRCKYEPTCSAYAIEAVDRFGAARGTLLAVWRLLRCNPFSHGGFDPVREEFTLKVGPMDPAVYHGETEPGPNRTETDRN
jgi:putative membrane protein insertion efficiency factor